MKSSFIIARVSHGKPVAFLTLTKNNIEGWTPKKERCYRFSSEAEASYYLATIPERLAIILPDSRIPTVAVHPAPPKGKPTPKRQPEPQPLTPFRYSQGQRIGLTVGSILLAMFALALMMGW